MGITYKSSGVDIAAGEETVNRIKPLVKSTFNERVLAEIGLFGGFYDAKFPEYKHPILVASTDGVGTKLKIAFQMGIHDTVGQDLVNHCCNDILCCGAKPLFFLDYFATGKLEPAVAEQVISGFVKACRENGCALIGGETAEMPSFYAEGEYDMSGNIIGLVDKDNIINGSKIQAGDLMVGIPSTGLHTNGYSLARNVLLSHYKVTDYVDSLGKSVGESLLEIHRSYYPLVYPLLSSGKIVGISHITGGGIVGNTSRIIPKNLEMKINWNSWTQLPIFQLIQKTGNIEDEEMRKAFNLGIGMILVVRKNDADWLLNELKQDKPVIIGEIA